MMTHHDLSFRQEFLKSLFKNVRSRDSCAAIGVSSVGKGRLLDFIFRPDVQEHYLGDKAKTLKFVRADANRAAELSEWGLYELLLTALIEAVVSLPAGSQIQTRIEPLRQETILSKNALLAQRHLETILRILCGEYGVQLVIVLDEFDAIYTNLPASTLANLRGLRDLVKTFDYGLSYVLMLRNDPAQLRDPEEVEGFYELISRNLLGLRPYQWSDANVMLDHALNRRNISQDEEVKLRIFNQAGGHGGLMDALVTSLAQNNQQKFPVLAIEECRKIWAGLDDEERVFLLAFIEEKTDKENFSSRSLALKGVLIGKQVFSPLFEQYLKDFCVSENREFILDKATRIVWVGNRQISDLSAREFQFVELLFNHADEVVMRDEVHRIVYPRESASDNDENRLDALVRRVREKIELVPGKPIYLITKPGAGFILVTNPS